MDKLREKIEDEVEKQRSDSGKRNSKSESIKESTRKKLYDNFKKQ